MGSATSSAAQPAGRIPYVKPAAANIARPIASKMSRTRAGASEPAYSQHPENPAGKSRPLQAGLDQKPTAEKHPAFAFGSGKPQEQAKPEAKPAVSVPGNPAPNAAAPSFTEAQVPDLSAAPSPKQPFTAGGKAASLKAQIKKKQSPKKGKSVRQQPVRMNGQPLRSSVRETHEAAKYPSWTPEGSSAALITHRSLASHN